TTICVGGLDNVDASFFQGFDYVALGHIHKPQQIGKKPVWYAGSPLKYSFGETSQTKEALLVRFGAKGLEEVKPLPFRPMREMRKIEGSLKEILEGAMSDSIEKSGQYQDYIQAILTDAGELIDPIGTIRSVYPNVMQIVRKEAELTSDKDVTSRNMNRMLAGQRDVLSLFEAFYQEVRQMELPDKSKRAVMDIVKELEGKE
ncbi:MAG: exonuclease SbcCD subunit D C-terminal domain-containing protein, partial [Lachnospiraceae bacterium]|nr:exonuclease SbcCD subunit D C-terminal domain-containing protein [Lachnospiraceae bacterium]